MTCMPTIPIDIATLLILYTTYAISLVFYFLSMGSIFRILRTRHREAFNRLGKPSVWKPLLSRRTFDFISLNRFPKDRELGFYTMQFRASRAVLFASMALLVVLSYAVYAGWV